jgi:Tol biopolymer transport system component
LHWTPSGDALTYISTAGGAGNVWLQPIRGGSPRQLTQFRDAEIYSFAWSLDGKQIACVRNIKVFVPMIVRLF